MSRPCPNCQRPYAAGRRFCGACRAVLAAICTTCGFTNDHDDSWCGGCARSLKAEQRWIPPQAEPQASASRSIPLPDARPASTPAPRHTTRAIAIAPVPVPVAAPARPSPPPAPRSAEIEVEIESPAKPKPRSTVSDSIDKMLATARARSPG